MRPEGPLDAIERAADHAQVGGVDTVGSEVVREQGPELLVDSGTAVQHVVRGYRGEGRPEIGQQPGIGVARGEVDDVRGDAGITAEAERGTGGDERSSSALAEGEAPVAERPVGGGDGVGRHPELRGQRSDGLEPLARCQLTGRDTALDVGHDVGRGPRRYAIAARRHGRYGTSCTHL